MAKYDPSKQYKWEESDEFAMNGNQFGLILNAFRNFLAKPECQEVMLMMKAEKEMTSLLAEGVESGVISEMTPPEPADSPASTPKKKPSVRKKPLVKA
jgi:hypothetical protein